MNVFDEQYEVCPHCGYLINSLPSVAYHLYPGTKLNDRFVVGTVLGYGGFGVTYNAWDTTLNIHVAIKEFFPQGLVNRIPGTKELIVLSGEKANQYQMGLQRFIDEAQNTVCFNSHPNIVNVSTFFEENNTAYIVMEFLDGISVKDYLKQEYGILSVEEAIEIVTAVCDALTEIHKRGIIHRDINPNNICLCDRGIKLIDFGAARISETEFERTRSIVITPGYAPPEQYQSKSKQGPWTDTYALCATLYRMLTGKRPLESIDRMVEDKLELPTVYNPNIPQWLESIIMNGIALNYEFRYKTAESLKTAILSQTQTALPEERIRKRRLQRMLLLIGAGVASLAVVMGTVFLISSKRAPSIKAGTELHVEVPADQLEYFQNLYDENFESYLKQACPEALNALTVTIDSKFDTPAVYAYGSHPDLPALPALTFFDSGINISRYYLVSDYYNQHPESTLIPTGFYEAQVYVSQSAAEKAGFQLSADAEASSDATEATASGLTLLTELTEKELEEDFFKAPTCLKSLKTNTPALTNALKKAKYADTAKAVDDFANRKVDVMIATNAEQSRIQEICAAANYADTTITTKYDILPLYIDGKTQGYWADGWCIADGLDESVQEAAKLWMNFLLTDGIQENMYTSGSDEMTAIPINRNAFTEYVKYNGGKSKERMDQSSEYFKRMEIQFMEENQS